MKKIVQRMEAAMVGETGWRALLRQCGWMSTHNTHINTQFTQLISDCGCTHLCIT